MLNDSQSVDAQRILSRAREVMDVEISGVRKVRDELGEPFVALVKKCLEILQDGGKLVLCGVGKKLLYAVCCFGTASQQRMTHEGQQCA